MKLLYICSDFGIAPEGTKGASVHLRSIIHALGRRGHDVRLLSPRARHAAEVGIKALDLPEVPALRKNTKAMRRWLEAHGHPSLVYRELRALNYNTMLSEAAIKSMGSWRPDAIIERLSLFGQGGIDLAQRCGVPHVLEVNALLTEEASTYRTLELRELARSIEQCVIDKTQAVMPVSSQLERWICHRGHDASTIHVVPNGVDVECFEQASARSACRAELGINGDFVAGFCGSLKAWHGVDVLVEAFDMLRRQDSHCRLVLVGSGPSESKLRALVEARGLERQVHFTGAVPHERVGRYLAAMDVAVAPFRNVDNFYFSPIKLFEYMASGSCVVASRLGQISEVIEHGRNGMLCSAENAPSLCEALRTLRDNPVMRQRMAGAAHDDVCSKFTWDQAAQRVEGILRGAKAPQQTPQPPTAAHRNGIGMEVLS